MGAPKSARFVASFDEWFPHDLCLVGEISVVKEYQPQEDRARNRPVRPRLDELTGKRLYRRTFAHPSAELERERSITVEFACDVQPVPPEAVGGMPFRLVALEGMMVQPRADAADQAKWITWAFDAEGMRWPSAAGTSGSSSRSAGKPAVGSGSSESRRAA
jgi:hypothetical protein